MKRLMLLLSAALAASVTVLASATDNTRAEERLRGCLSAGSINHPHTELLAAIVAVRALCGVEIKRVRTERVTRARKGLVGRQAERAERQAIRNLNDEIAVAIANFTGLRG
jgi:hypothetical protein